MPRPAAAEPDPPRVRFPAQKLLRPIAASLAALRDENTERDTAGNRHLFCDQYLALLIFYFLNPALTSLRALQKTTGWEKTQKVLGIESTSLGSLGEAAGVFDPARVEPLIAELAGQAAPLSQGREAEALAGLVAADGTLLPALTRMRWALWQDDEHRAAKVHLQFDVLKGVPIGGDVTPGACSEGAALARRLEAGRLYVVDRGYACYALFARVLAAGSSLVARVKDDIAYQVEEERDISPAAAKAGVVRDARLSRLGTPHHKDVLKRPMRLVVVRAPERDGRTGEIWLITDRLDLDADLVALAYRYRWTVELFFRWLKCILGSRHLLSHSRSGVQFQVYAAMIVSLLLAIRAGMKPTKRLLEAVSFYLAGWLTDAELQAAVAAERAAAARAAAKKMKG